MQIAQHTCEVVELRKTATGTVQVGIRPVPSADASALPPAPTPGAQHYVEVEAAAAPALGAQISVTYATVEVVV
ncbi:MAG: hypothetical protein KY464_12175 [Gemmatimonadetes bacterium]|nr:hypothetical protein [Gemmatimonadota bacterium]